MQIRLLIPLLVTSALGIHISELSAKPQGRDPRLRAINKLYVTSLSDPAPLIDSYRTQSQVRNKDYRRIESLEGKAIAKIRTEIEKGKTCFSLAPTVDEADAIMVLVVVNPPLEVSLRLGPSYRRMALILLSKDLEELWGVQTDYMAYGIIDLAGSTVGSLLKSLAKDAACKERTKALRSPN